MSHEIFVAYLPLTEPSVRDFSNGLYLCKQAEADAWVYQKDEADTRRHWEIIYEFTHCRYSQSCRSKSEEFRAFNRSGEPQ